MARPRKHPAGLPAWRDYKRGQRDALRARGGRIVQLILEPGDAAALAAIQTPEESEADAIRRAIHQAASCAGSVAAS